MRKREPSGKMKEVRKGLWSPEEDEKLKRYMSNGGQGCWSEVARNAGLQRCGKSCRLRWINYLRPHLKRSALSPHEQHLIFHFHSFLGNRWSQIAARLPGRTDNEIKNFWNSTMKKRLKKDVINMGGHVSAEDHHNSFNMPMLKSSASSSTNDRIPDGGGLLSGNEREDDGISEGPLEGAPNIKVDTTCHAVTTNAYIEDANSDRAEEMDNLFEQEFMLGMGEWNVDDLMKDIPSSTFLHFSDPHLCSHPTFF